MSWTWDAKRLRRSRLADRHLFFIILCRRLRRLSFLFFYAHPLGALGAVRKCGPRGFGTTETLAHMRERRRFRLGPGLRGAGEQKLQIRIADDWSGQAYSASGPTTSVC